MGPTAPAATRPRLAHQRIEPVGERDDGHDPGGVGRPDQFGRLLAVDGQRLLADHVLAGGQGRLCEACRWLGVQMWTTSTSGAVTSDSASAKPRSAPSARAASRALEADEAATPTNRAPARRAAWAWTAPMKPVPATATRSGAWSVAGPAGPAPVDVSRALANASVAPSMVVMLPHTYVGCQSKASGTKI